PSGADAAVVDAGKICFAADPRAEADVQRVIPDAQLRHRRRIDGGDEVDHARMRDVDDVFVGANAVERRHLEARYVVVLYLQAPARVCESDDRTLRLRPFQNRQVPRWPVFDAMRLRIILILQTE